MSEFFSKIEDFLFDILGLVLPGGIFLLIFISPTIFLDLSSVPQVHIKNSFVLSGLTTISKILKIHWTNDMNFTLVVILVLAYLIGHVIKVFSIIKYDLLGAIFDKSLNKLVTYLLEKTRSLFARIYKKVFNRDMYKSKIYIQLDILYSPIKGIINKIFTFAPPPYFSDNDPLKTDCVNLLNQKLATNYPDKWYSIFKFSTVLHKQENVKSLSGNFLAKYNLYRSLAFIFIFTLVYYYYFFSACNPFISFELLKLKKLLLLSIVVLWFTFHYKFKRYWTLCGNETLVSLFYFLNKKKFNEARQNIIY